MITKTTTNLGTLFYSLLALFLLEACQGFLPPLLLAFSKSCDVFPAPNHMMRGSFWR
jgi:hypothetical protein